ncbi:exported hypothetical protein [groundwater metagenome]|uniref:Uncharacterized protein n=1 Tax=groundwater metagenome TaxID=717931 RepID=A0A098EBQ3_9ZZZZ
MVINLNRIFTLAIGAIIISVLLISGVFISGCVEEKRTSKDELLNLLEMPSEQDYNASYFDYISIRGTGTYMSINGEITVQNGNVKYYKYMSNNRGQNLIKEYSSDKGWLNCKDAPGVDPTVRTETIYLNCSNEYKELTIEYQKNKLILDVSSAQNVTQFYDVKEDLICFSVNGNMYYNYNICFDKEWRFVKWYIQYARVGRGWTKIS